MQQLNNQFVSGEGDTAAINAQVTIDSRRWFQNTSWYNREQCTEHQYYRNGINKQNKPGSAHRADRAKAKSRPASFTISKWVVPTMLNKDWAHQYTTANRKRDTSVRSRKVSIMSSQIVAFTLSIRTHFYGWGWTVYSVRHSIFNPQAKIFRKASYKNVKPLSRTLLFKIKKFLAEFHGNGQVFFGIANCKWRHLTLKGITFLHEVFLHTDNHRNIYMQICT